MSDLAPEVPAAPDPEGAAPTTEPAWSGPSQEEWEQVQQANAYLLDLVQQAQQPAGEPGVTLDPFADDFQGQLEAWYEAKSAPLTQYQQQAVLGEAEERARDILADDASSNGEFDLETARALADKLLPEMNAQYGWGPQAAEAALRKAAAMQRDKEAAIAKAAVERWQNELTGLSGAPRIPGAGTAAAQNVVVPEGGDELDVVARYTRGG